MYACLFINEDAYMYMYMYMYLGDSALKINPSPILCLLVKPRIVPCILVR